MAQLHRRALALLALTTSACAGGGLNRVPSDARPAPEHRAEIERRRLALEEARAAHAAAERTVAAQRLALDARRAERTHAETRRAAEDELGDRARALGLSDVAAVYEARRVPLERELELAERAVDVARAEVVLAERQLELRGLERLLSDAEWEEAKAAGAERAGGPPVSLAAFKAQVAEIHGRVAAAQENAARAWSQLEERRKQWAEASARLPAESEVARERAQAEEARGRLEARIQTLEARIRELERAGGETAGAAPAAAPVAAP